MTDHGDFIFLGANNDVDAFMLFDAELLGVTIEMNILQQNI